MSRLADADQNTRVYSYEGEGTSVLVQGTAGQGETWTQATTQANLDAGGTDALNKQDMVTYGDAANPYSPTQAQNRNGQSAQMSYDSVGNVLSTTVPVHNGSLTTNYTYDYSGFAPGRLRAIQVGGKTSTTIDYYPNTNLVWHVGTPLPGASGTGQHVYTTYTYTALGNVETVTMPAPADNGTVQYSYNYVSDPWDGTTQSEALGRPLTITDPMNHVTHLRYDSRGNLIATITLAGGQYRRTDIQYNIADQPVSVTYPATGQTGAGRSSVVTTYQYPGGPAVSTALYDEAGNLVRQTGVSRGGEGQVKQQTGSTEHSSQVLDGLSRLNQLKDGNGNPFTHVYDVVGNLKQFTYPGGNTESATFDPDGNAKTFTDGRGRTSTYTLSPDDSSVTGVAYPDATPAAQYNYDTYGRVTSIIDSRVTLRYAYDDLDNVVTATTDYAPLRQDINPFVLNYAYYPDGHRKALSSLQLPNSGEYYYAYDANGKLTQVTFPWSDTCSYAYDEGDRLVTQTVTYPQVGSLSVTRYQYNALDQLVGQVSRKTSASNSALQLGFYNMLHDATGNLLSMQDGYSSFVGYGSMNGTRAYSYDIEDRLIGESAVRPAQQGQQEYTGLAYVNYNYTHSYDEADNFLTQRGQTVNTPSRRRMFPTSPAPRR